MARRSLAQLEARLRASSHGPGWELLRPRRAAVALVLREGDAGPELLLMRRAKRPGDPWSGDVSLPGGRQEPTDTDLVHTARREALEEVGLQLDGVPTIGRLPDQLAKPTLKLSPLVVTPYVFALPDPAHPPFVLSHEATRAFWVPLEPLEAGSCAGTHLWSMGAVKLRMPCWNWDGEVIWGLTYRIVETLFEELR
ncbi:MAG: NUDIX hydrolase [Myxococcales bacterium]